MNTYRHTEAPFSATFKLYNPDGVQVMFTCRAETASEHVATLSGYMATLSEVGYAPQLPGLEPGEKIEHITGYVVGEKSNGEPCVHLYGNERLEWRIATVWKEQFDLLPFPVDVSRTWPGSAPSRDIAANKGWLQSADFEIVMEPTGKQTDNGRDAYRFARVNSKPVQTEPLWTQPEEDNTLLGFGDAVVVAGKNDEVSGLFIGTTADSHGNTLYRVEVNKIEYKVSPDRVTPVPG